MSGSAAVTKTFIYMLRVKSAHALSLVALPYSICSALLALGRQEETVGIHREDRRWSRLDGKAGWRNSVPMEKRSAASVVLDYQSSCQPELEQPQAKLNSVWNRTEKWLFFCG